MLTICLPVFNGEKTLGDTLNSLFPILGDAVKLVIVDDCSTDGSRTILSDLEHPNVSVCFNELNLGMDENFLKCAELSDTRYVWFFGQDDYLKLEEGRLLINYIQNCSADFVSCDYDKYDVATSMLTERYIESNIQRKELKSIFQEFDNLEHYSQYFRIPPTFLPATIINREVFLKGEHLDLLDTNYVQLGRLIVNSEGKCYHFAKSIVRGDIPDDGWQTIGFKRLSIAIGKLLVLKYSTKYKSWNLRRRFYWREIVVFWLTVPKTLIDLNTTNYSIVEPRLLRLGRSHFWLYRLFLFIGLGKRESWAFKFYHLLRAVK
ncbi:glycosyltransferase [Schleiferiaceae bacterium]|nr:glycosyltransferase [Schleiferiaceae bacterium]